MLDDKFLDKWVKIIVPEEYGPNKDPAAGKPILGIYVIPPEKMETIKAVWYKDTPEGSKLFGQIVDVGEMLTLAGNMDSELRGRYIIRLNASQSEACGLFTLSHEIGHLYGMLMKDEKHEEDQEEYADRFAFRRIRETIKDVDLRVRVYTEAFMQERV